MPTHISWRHRLVAQYYRTPEHRGHLRLLNLLKDVLHINSVRVEVSPGVVMELDDRDYVQREILFKGGYEPATLALFDRLVASARGCLDIGAHHGQYALRAARSLAERGGRVVAVEPSPANGAALLRNADLSSLTNIDLFTCALARERAVMELAQPQPGNSGGTRLFQEGYRQQEGPTVHVAVHPFSDIAHLVPETALDLVKIDVEGLEGQMLTSLFATGARPRHIVLEYIPTAFDYGLGESIPVWLTSRRYRVRTIAGIDYHPEVAIPEGNLWAEAQS